MEVSSSLAVMNPTNRYRYEVPPRATVLVITFYLGLSAWMVYLARRYVEMQWLLHCAKRDLRRLGPRRPDPPPRISLHTGTDRRCHFAPTRTSLAANYDDPLRRHHTHRRLRRLPYGSYGKGELLDCSYRFEGYVRCGKSFPPRPRLRCRLERSRCVWTGFPQSPFCVGTSFHAPLCIGWNRKIGLATGYGPRYPSRSFTNSAKNCGSSCAVMRSAALSLSSPVSVSCSSLGSSRWGLSNFHNFNFILPRCVRLGDFHYDASLVDGIYPVRPETKISFRDRGITERLLNGQH